jgi:hypothetical protein
MLWDVPPWVPVSGGGGFAVHLVPFWWPSFGLGVVVALLGVRLVAVVARWSARVARPGAPPH